MKKRLGFVSNSSASSFVIQIRRGSYDDQMEITSSDLSTEKIELLKECGFTPVNYSDPFRAGIRNLAKVLKDAQNKDSNYLGYWMTCNQDCVLTFLVSHDIPFKASVHYGHYLYSYDKGGDYVYVLRNYGVAHVSNPKELFDKEYKKYSMKQKPYKRIKKKEFVKDHDEHESLLMMGVKQ